MVQLLLILSQPISQVSAMVLPSHTKPKPNLYSLKLADPQFNVLRPIDILLGVDIYHDIIKSGIILGPRGTPAAQEPIFGWVLFGSTSAVAPSPKPVTALHALAESHTCENLLHKFWSLEEAPAALSLVNHPNV